MTNTSNEDSKKEIQNRFELCLIASNRAKAILSGAPTNYARSMKPATISLNEISDKSIDIEQVRRNIASGDNVYQDESSENEVDKIISDKKNIFASENISVAD